MPPEPVRDPLRASLAAGLGSIAATPLTALALGALMPGAGFFDVLAVAVRATIPFAWAAMLPLAALHGILARRFPLPSFAPPLSAGAVVAALAWALGLDAEAAAIAIATTLLYAGWFAVILGFLMRPRDGSGGGT